MRTTRLRFVAVVALLAGFVAALPAQDTPTSEELTLRPGDSITWIPAPQHSLRFGGKVTHNNASLPLTAPEDVEKLLAFKPPLPPKPATGDDIRTFEDGEKVTATVKDEAAKQKVLDFFFTCGRHPNPMVTMSFTVKPAIDGQKPRPVVIEGGPGLQWFLVTPDGKKKPLKRP